MQRGGTTNGLRVVWFFFNGCESVLKLIVVKVVTVNI